MTAPGWFRDPSQSHEHRYFDGRGWTDHVADAGRQTTDPLVPGSASPPPPPPPPALPPPAPPPGAPGGEAIPGALEVVPADPAPAAPGADGAGPWASMDESVERLAISADRRMRSAAAWFACRGRPKADDADVPVLDQAPDEAILGEWTAVASAVQTLADAVIPGGSDTLAVLRAIAGSEDAQTRLLQSIDSKVDLLLKGPHNTGLTYLGEARRLGFDGPDALECTEHAREAFYAAHGQSASVQGRSLVEYHLGLSWLMLGRQDDAVHWLARSHASAFAVIDELARHANVEVSRRRDGTAPVWAHATDIVSLGFKFRKLVGAERAQRALQNLLPFVECVTRCHNSLVDEARRLPAPSIAPGDDDGFTLVPVELDDT